MADGDALAVARRAWERWVAADLESFLAMWAPDGVWTMAGTSRISGSHKGVDAIGEVARLAFELSGGTLKAVPKELAASGPESVLGYFHVTAEREGATLDQDGLQRMIIRDGKLVAPQPLDRRSRGQPLLRLTADPRPPGVRESAVAVGMTTTPEALGVVRSGFGSCIHHHRDSRSAWNR